MNRLGAATSPYLLQHEENPVDWWEWGDDAFAEAVRRDVPVLLSIGYAACHWCHVMADESFSDPVVAGYLNTHFVAIKVDREERPDVDAVYMNAVQAMTGQGGWPLTAFLTPAGKPFYAGTYFPRQPRGGMPSFRQLLEAVTDTWVRRRGEVDESATAITASLGGRLPAGSGADVPSAADLDAAVGVLTGQFDGSAGGFGGAPKFPPSMVLEFLLRHHARTADPQALAMVELTCEQMARGGIYDQLGGGFARYSVDAGWVVPHFEKMLYDNALLLRVYTNWWRSTGSSLAERVVREAAEFLLHDLRTPEGGFASALDADAPKVPGGPHTEGASYVWTPDELRAVLGDDDGAWAASMFGVTAAGTFEDGASTLRRPAEPPDPNRWQRVRTALLAARSQRPQPARDDKVVTAWNGLAIAALAQAGALFGEQRWLEAAVECADLLVRVHLDDAGRLRRASIEGRAGSAAGVLEDYGDLAEGFLALVAATGEATWLALAEQVLDEALARFVDDDGVFDTADDATDARLAAIGRPQDPTDNATPAGRSALAGALLSFAAYTGSARHRSAAEFALGAYRPLAVRAPRFAGWALAVAEALVAGPLEVAVVGAHDDERTAALAAAARRHLSPGAALVVGAPGGEDASAIPLLRHRDLVDGAPAAYVCRHFACDRPATDPRTLVAQLASSS